MPAAPQAPEDREIIDRLIIRIEELKAQSEVSRPSVAPIVPRAVPAMAPARSVGDALTLTVSGLSTLKDFPRCERVRKQLALTSAAQNFPHTFLFTPSFGPGRLR